MPAFARYVGIDYSGAETAESSLKGLRVFIADAEAPPREVPPPPSPKKYWTRRALAFWLEQLLSEPVPALVGIDHSFSFPLAYFRKYCLPPDWDHFLEDFCAHWPTGEEFMYVDFVRDGLYGRGAQRSGNPRWRRLAEIRCGAKSVFHFDVPGSVAKSTHAGLPWLLHLRRALGSKLHFWPYDGWDLPPARSTVVEVYPSLCRDAFPAPGLTPDQQDAFAAASWLRHLDVDGGLATALCPHLTPADREIAGFEGWILGVGAGLSR